MPYTFSGSLSHRGVSKIIHVLVQRDGTCLTPPQLGCQRLLPSPFLTATEGAQGKVRPMLFLSPMKHPVYSRGSWPTLSKKK